MSEDCSDAAHIARVKSHMDLIREAGGFALFSGNTAEIAKEGEDLITHETITSVCVAVRMCTGTDLHFLPFCPLGQFAPGEPAVLVPMRPDEFREWKSARAKNPEKTPVNLPGGVLIAS